VSDLTRDPAKDRGVTDVKHKVQAIGSSSLGKATTFSEKFIPPSVIARPTVYDSYEQVYNDPEVDIVYVATPHALHLRNALDAIQAGKHVLCEKPMTINARDSEILIKAAREKGVFLMEGWCAAGCYCIHAVTDPRISQLSGPASFPS
jgi:dihydrodiol dehydrogenase / D-xylose 1-dehydrogenase (NADP)